MISFETILIIISIILSAFLLGLLITKNRLMPKFKKLKAVKEEKYLNKIVNFFLIAVVLMQVVIIIVHTVQVQRIPMANVYEFCLLLPTVIFMVTLWNSRQGGNLYIIFAILTIVFNIGCIFIGGGHGETMEILDSFWLPIHVFAAMLSYSVFAITFLVAGYGLIKKNRASEKDCYHLIRGIGLPALTFAIISGAMWAESAWGRYWGWDPKETWALITWVMYMVYLHLRTKKIFVYKGALLMVIIGFLLVIFTFFGVSYLMEGLHSYS